jgi:hypothetical protein
MFKNRVLKRIYESEGARKRKVEKINEKCHNSYSSPNSGNKIKDDEV